MGCRQHSFSSSVRLLWGNGPLLLSFVFQNLELCLPELRNTHGIYYMLNIHIILMIYCFLKILFILIFLI